MQIRARVAGDVVEVRFVTTSQFGTLVGTNLQVTSTAVPEPGSTLLFASGLLGTLAWVRRRRRETAGSLAPA